MHTAPFSHSPIKAGEDSRRNWKSINKQGESLEGLAAAVANLSSVVAQLQQQTGARFLHPFQIYVFPAAMRVTPGANDWRTVRVHAGTIFIDWVEVTPTGTDGAANPDVGELTTAGDIVCDAAAEKHWIWLELTSSTASIENSATAPTWDSSHIPLGWVDTDTYAAEKRVVVRQFVRTDLFTCL